MLEVGTGSGCLCFLHVAEVTLNARGADVSSGLSLRSPGCGSMCRTMYTRKRASAPPVGQQYECSCGNCFGAVIAPTSATSSPFFLRQDQGTPQPPFQAPFWELGRTVPLFPCIAG